MAFSILVEGKALPQHVDTVREALRTLARESMQQPGTLRYEFYQPQDDPARFILFAKWEDEAGWQANVKSDEHDRYNKSLPEDAWETRPHLRKLQPLDAST